MKILFFLSLFIINIQVIGQVGKDTLCYHHIREAKDTIPGTDSNIIIIKAKNSGLTKEDIQTGFYKVVKIDSFSSFYLIFIEKDMNINTIYSEKLPLMTGQKLEVDSMYYFELICKNYFENGICYHPVDNITYFGKYKGYELGKLYIAKNLNGLAIISNK